MQRRVRFSLFRPVSGFFSPVGRKKIGEHGEVFIPPGMTVKSAVFTGKNGTENRISSRLDRLKID